jgi:branched-chain amino acid transport system permease protein
MPVSFFLQMFLNGLQLASVYILIALGFTLIFGILQIVNIAHGSIYMLGGYGIWLLFVSLKLNYFLSLLFTSVIVALIGLAIERIIFRRLRGLMMSTIIASIGVMGFIEQSALLGFGVTHKIIPNPFPGMLQFWGTVFPTQRLVIMIFGIVLTVAVIWWIRRTKAGLALRAVSQDNEVAALYGINSVRYGSLTFGIGCGLAGAAGALMAPVFYVTPFIGHGPLLKIFVIIVIGGLGSVPGAVLAGVLLGLIDSFVTTLIDSESAAMFGFIMIIVMLVFKPKGFFGHE